MLRGAVGRPVGCRCQLGSLVGPSLLQVPRLASFRAPRAVRLVVSSSWNPFDKSKGKDGSSDAGKQDAARKALESLGKKGRPGSKPEPTPPPAGSPKQGAPGPSFSFGGAGGGGQGFGFGGGGGGGGGGGQGGAPQGGGDNEAEKPILTELKELFWGMWVVGWNAAAFLLFACFLHRSLPWFVQTELLIAVGAPQQAMERFFGVFFDMLEWVEKHLLGWDIPDENAGNMRMFEVIRDYDPPEAAYTFAQYRYPLTGQEQDTLLKAHAVKSFERRGGYAGDVDPRDVQAIYDKYEPQEADRRAYREAVKSGTVAEYRASKAAQAQAAKYQDYLNPRGAERAAAAAAAAAAGGSAK